MRDVRYYSARNDELQKENDAIMDILSKHVFDGDKEIVRLVKRNLTLTKENEKLLSRMETMEGAIENADIEKLAEAVHHAYCYDYLKRTGDIYWSKGDYSKLNEETKEIDRATVRAVLKALNNKDGK